MNNKYYLSLPISGKDLNEVKERARWLKDSLKENNEIDVITPFDVCPDSSLPYSELMGKDIAALLECKTIIMDYDWEKSKGCRAERDMAIIYGIRIKYIEPVNEDTFILVDNNIDYRMELTKKQLAIISFFSDFSSNIINGNLNFSLPQIFLQAYKKNHPDASTDDALIAIDRFKKLCDELKKAFWDKDVKSNNGIHYDDVSDILYDIHQVARHQLWIDKPEPKFQYTVDAYVGRKTGSEPLIKIEKI